MKTRSDEFWMSEAIGLARQGQGNVEPNPMVGCVLVRDGRLIGQGYHQTYGGLHAEPNALADCANAGETAAGATAYVTLEPCCHHGKTPPCADALIKAGVSRVVVAVTDPFPAVDGGGLRRLSDAGIEVVVGVGEAQSRRVLAPYLKRVQTGRPWVIAKWAMSMDGRIATSLGESQWITGEESRREVHQLRRRVDAIMVGMGTVVADDPLLTARCGEPSTPGPATDSAANDSATNDSAANMFESPSRTPTRLVFARHRVPDLKSQLVRTASEVPTWVVAGPSIRDSTLALLADHDVETLRCENEDAVAMIDEVLIRLGCEENPSFKAMTNLMLEGGGELLGSFAAAGHIDEAHVYVGAKLIGGRAAPGPVGDPGFARLAEASRFEIESVQQFGQDVRTVYRKQDSSSPVR